MLMLHCAVVQFCTDTSLTQDNDKTKPSASTTVTLSDSLTAERRAAVRCKPPNVVIYCGKKDSSRQFMSVKSVVNQCVNIDRYIIYHLKHEQVRVSYSFSVKRTIKVSKNHNCHCTGTTKVAVKVMGRDT